MEEWTDVAAAAKEVVSKGVDKFKELLPFFHSKPVPIIKFSVNAEVPPEFMIDDFRTVLSKKGAYNMPVYPIVITGELRTGKSFLLNLMKMYLTYRMETGTDEGWEECKAKVEGGAWARGSDSVTHGIWVWDHPFIINGKAFILVDCQGTGDTQFNSPTLDNLILYIGMNLSSVFILNLQSRLTSNQLEKLHLCTEYADLDSDGGQLFDSLTFLIRDFKEDDDIGERPDLLEKLRSTQESTNQKLVAGLYKAFQEVSTFTLPDPGKKVTKVSEADKKLKLIDIDEDFLVGVKQLFGNVFDRQSLGPVRTGEDVVRKLMALKNRTIDSKVGRIKIASPAEALQESLLAKAFFNAQVYFDERMTQVAEGEYEDESSLHNALVKVVNDMVNNFCSDQFVIKVPESDSKSNYINLLKAKMGVVEERKRMILAGREAKRLKEEADARQREAESLFHDMQLEMERARLEQEEKAAELEKELAEMKAARQKEIQKEEAAQKKQITVVKQAYKKINQSNEADPENKKEEWAKKEKKKFKWYWPPTWCLVM